MPQDVVRRDRQRPPVPDAGVEAPEELVQAGEEMVLRARERARVTAGRAGVLPGLGVARGQAADGGRQRRPRLQRDRARGEVEVSDVGGAVDPEELGHRLDVGREGRVGGHLLAPIITRSSSRSSSRTSPNRC